jgi:excinuclease UvrABC nuclease subunit
VTPLPPFDHAIDFDPAGDVAAFLKTAPAKWAVYLMADAEDRPVQLLCVKDLRHSLERRLGQDVSEERTKRVDYRDLVRRVHWRRVDSALEADLVYWSAARSLFPNGYQGIMANRPSWFVHVDPSAVFPRYVRTTDVAIPTGELIGPIEEKQGAQKLIQLAEDAFDLCRYYNVLTEAPHGKACAYKEMGRCPAPCDGTVSMDRYREMVAASCHAMVDPSAEVAAETRRMNDAAAELRFEQAGKIKARIDLLSQFAAGPFRHARRIQDFQYLAVQRGPREGTAKLFLITPGSAEEVAGLIAEPESSSDLLREILTLAADRARLPLDATATERVGLVAHHLFLPKQQQGVFLRIAELENNSLARAYRELKKQKEPDATGEGGEGVVREAQPTLATPSATPGPPA